MELRGFAKTKLLSPGESQTLTITFPKYEAASYDEYGDTGHKAAWVLEAGDYHILVGDSVDSAAKNVFGKVNVPQTLVTKQLANRFNPTKLEKV
ncbi:MAG: fibronectin type III-like domain-contianing protein, partial [Abditibacteriota bacterium]|nr:fibronectin type III-like domain-contianing protein [Abditibacteriota bacterium]